MKNKLRRIIFSIIYKKLNLQTIEDEFNQKQIPKKEIANPTNDKLTSEYFFLLNDLYMDRLSNEELNFVSSKIEYNNDKDKEELEEFLNNNMLRLIIPDTTDKEISWGIRDYQTAPADAIAIAFHTLEYLNGEDLERNKYVQEKLKYIEDVLGPQCNLKIAVIKYNELPVNIVEI